MRIAVGSDHAGFHLKQELAERREHERLNQHSIALLDAKLGEKYVSKLNKKQYYLAEKYTSRYKNLFQILFLMKK